MRRNRPRIFLVAVVALALVLVPLPRPAMAASTAAMPSDFDGDGYADLAIGVPGEGAGHPGAVNVLYGSAGGVSAAGDQSWSKGSPGIKGTASSSDNFGWVLASGDFDRDGYADLAIGSGDRATNTRPGSVNILYGSASGLTAIRDQLWTPANLPDGVSDICVGYALASADFDGDGYRDLAIGGRGVDPTAVGGYVLGVTVLYGGVDGLTTSGATVVSADAPISGESWGLALAAGDMNGDGLADLAMGDPTTQAREGHCSYACGAVAIHSGSPKGLSATRDSLWDLDHLGWGAEWDDFGRVLAIGDFNDDGFGDLVIGSPELAVGDDLGWGEGAIVILPGSPAGPTAEGWQILHGDREGVPGTSQAGDRFGRALAAGRFDDDPYEDLAIGVPGEGANDAGAVIALYGGPTGIATTRAQRWTQASSGVPGMPEQGDAFGFALASADYGHSGRGDLAIGVEGEAISGHVAGMVNLLYGRASGLSGIDSQGWSQNTAGVKGTIQGGDGFGWSLTP